MGAHAFVISSGPHKYATKTLPDPEIVAELGRRGWVYRTDKDDAGCATRPQKIGSDADGSPGGCDNIRITIDAASETTTDYWEVSD